MNLRKLALASLITAVAGIPAVTMADSDLSIGGTPATADLRFSIVIPQFIYFQVGASAVPADLDTVSFNLGAVEPGSDVDVADSNNPVDVVLRSNVPVTISAEALAGSGPLAAGSTEIIATPSNPSIPVPGFGSSAPQVLGPIDATGTWTFVYDNDLPYAAGTYTDTVTYTAATP
jgi:hypothetical protein